MGKILVTGASGRLGRALVSGLVFNNEKIRAVVRHSASAVFTDAVELFAHDLSLAPLPASAFKGVDRVVHLAGLIGEYPYSQLMLHNAKATENTLANCPPSVKRVVIASSISVYSEYKGKLVDETFSTKTESPYGKSKLEAEKAARRHCPALPITFLRFGMIYGKEFTDGYFSVFSLLSKGKMSIIGDGKNRMPLLHVDDAVSAIILSLSAHTPPCREYNIVGEEKCTQEELLSIAARELGVPHAKQHMGRNFAIFSSSLISALPAFKKPKFSSENIRQLSMDRAYSTERAENELCFKARVKLASGIKEMAGIFLKTRGFYGKS